MLSIVAEVEWALGLVWTTWNISPPPRFFPRTVQPVTIRCTDYAIPAWHGLPFTNVDLNYVVPMLIGVRLPL
jgi:hypothetical protein